MISNNEVIGDQAAIRLLECQPAVVSGCLLEGRIDHPAPPPVVQGNHQADSAASSAPAPSIESLK